MVDVVSRTANFLEGDIQRLRWRTPTSSTNRRTHNLLDFSSLQSTAVRNFKKPRGLLSSFVRMVEIFISNNKSMATLRHYRSKIAIESKVRIQRNEFENKSAKKKSGERRNKSHNSSDEATRNHAWEIVTDRKEKCVITNMKWKRYDPLRTSRLAATSSTSPRNRSKSSILQKPILFSFVALFAFDFAARSMVCTANHANAQQSLKAARCRKMKNSRAKFQSIAFGVVQN